jgi:hypothetical protein
MSRKASAYNQIIHLLQELHKLHPTYNMGRHLSMALDAYGDVWGLTDKELLFALEKYRHEMDIEDPDIEKILKEGADLDNILNEEDGEDY